MHDRPGRSFQQSAYQGRKPFPKDKKSFSHSLHQTDNEIVETRHPKISNVNDNNGATVEWIRQYEPNDMPSDDEAVAIAVDHQGNIIVTGQSDSMLTGYDFVTVKYNPEGFVLWERRYNGPEDSDDIPVGLVIDDSDNIYVCGNSVGDYTTIKYDPDGNQEWIRRLDKGFIDRPVAIAIDSSNNIYVTGSTYNEGSNYDFTTVKYNSGGNVIWSVDYKGSGYSYDIAGGLAVDSIGNVYVTGQSGSSLSLPDYVTVRYDKYGSKKWETRISDGDPNMEGKVTVDNSGYIYVTGPVRGAGTDDDFVTEKYDSSGNLKWSRRYDSSNFFDLPSAIVTDKKQNVYVTGASFTTDLGTVYTTIKYNSSGDEMWVRKLSAPSKDGAASNGLIVDQSENVYVTGEISTGGYPQYGNYGTVKYDSIGDEKWVRIYDGSGKKNDIATSISIDNAGNIYVAGTSDGLNTRMDFVTIKYDYNGTEQWLQRFNTTTYSQTNAKAIGIDKFDNIYVGGTSYQDYVIVKYDSLGNLVWNVEYNDPVNGVDVLTGMVVDSNGYVYVTGGSWDTTSPYDMVTLKYSPAGKLLWMSQYDGGAHDWARAITVDGFGNVYITGESAGLTGDYYDYATIKYDSLGNEIWVKRHTTYYVDYPYAILVDKLGNVYITGESEMDSTDYDIVTIKYDMNGNEKWVRRYNGAGNSEDKGEALAIDSSYNLYVAGGAINSSLSMEYVVIKYDSSGNELWVRSQYFGGYDGAHVIALDQTGNVYAAGRSYGFIKYDAEGNLQLLINLTGVSADGIVIDNLGGICLAGTIESVRGYDYDYLMMKFDASGSLKSSAIYNGPRNSNDEGSGIVVDSRGNIIVTGTTYKGWTDDLISSKGASATFSTIKYNQGLTDAAEKDAIITKGFELYNNYPNPFNPSTTITYSLPKQSYVQLTVYDILGRKVKTLVDREEIAGVKSVLFDASNLSNGVYFYRLHAGKFTEVRKMLLMK